MVLIVSVCATTSCTRTIEVPNTEIETLNSSDARSWRVETTNGNLYSVVEFRNTDSVMVVEKTKSVRGENNEGNEFVNVDPKSLPILIPHDEIVSIQGLYLTETRKILFVSAIAAVAGVAALLTSFLMFSRT